VGMSFVFSSDCDSHDYTLGYNQKPVCLVADTAADVALLLRAMPFWLRPVHAPPTLQCL
jgi:hypothetical protein